MIRKRMLKITAALLALAVLAGCWDSEELTDRSFWLATGWDAGKDGNLRLSGQLIVPAKIRSNVGGASGGGGGGGGGSGDDAAERGFFVITKEGRSLGEALQNIQSELSREILSGHRRVILIGEELAKQGIGKIFDANVRSPRVSIRTDVFVVRGGTAEDGLKAHSVFEPISASAIIKYHEQIGGRGDTVFLDLLTAVNSDGLRPALPALEIYKPPYTQGKRKVRISGLAVFDKNLKLAGFLNLEEHRDYLWITGDSNKRTLSMIKNGGGVSLLLIQLRRRIVPEIGDDGKVRFHVKLKADAIVHENNSGMSISRRAELKKLERAFERQAEKSARRTIRKVQREYGADIFGFGEVIHRRKPRRWNALKEDWDRRFSEAEIAVTVDLTIQQEGLAEHPAIHKESGGQE